MSLHFNRENLKGFVSDQEIKFLELRIQNAHQALKNKSGKGSDFSGWLDLPKKIEDSFLQELVDFGKEVRSQSDCLISIGIGGSYLGIRATLEFLRNKTPLPVYYAGHNMSGDYLFDLLQTVKEQRISVVVISKSGTTTEPAVAFRIIKNFLEERSNSSEIKKRIICVTDAQKGALHHIAQSNGYKTFVIPDDVGGRFSVLTPVGLVPLAIAGVDINGLVEGARQAQEEYNRMNLGDNAAHQYAACRYLLFQKGKGIEVLSSFYDNLGFVAEWWKQLFGESEGKDGNGIFPASLLLSTDLHSLGQLLQDGVRNIFETFLLIDQPQHEILIPEDKENLDQFNCLAQKSMDFVNKQAYRATAMAHSEGGVPNMTISLCKADAFHLGYLYYFFMKAVAISGYLLDVNPFDQPGVEAYKKKMFALLGKK